MRFAAWRGALAVVGVLITAVAVTGQDGLARAKELYLSASYDEALLALDALPQEIQSGSAVEVWQYRAFCLLALQRNDEARTVIERIYTKDPLYALSDTQSSPRVRTIFDEVRHEVLPVVVQKEYAAAKQAFDRKDPRATERFDHVLLLLNHPDMKDVATADFRTLVAGFRDLSRATASAVPAPVRAVEASPPPPPPKASAPEVVMVLPVPVYRPLPTWVPLNSVDARKVFSGQLEIAIDKTGRVLSASLTAPIYPLYDEQLLQFARRWRYQPATRNGTPVPFQMVVPIQIQQTTPKP